MTKFLLFSLKRSGSTTLLTLLNLQPDLRCMREPFNPGNFGGRYHAAVSGPESLDAVLEEIWRTHDGLKHVWETDGWPFPDPELNAHLILRAAPTVVFLRRRNVLQRVVSNEISRQTEVWTPFTRGHRERVAGFAYRPISVDAVRRQVAGEPHLLDGLRDRLREQGRRVLEVWYEDLYDAAATPGERRARFEEVVRFLGRQPLDDPHRLARVDALLDPAVTRLNSEDTYRRIPGVEEIERTCGADDTGWLFR